MSLGRTLACVGGASQICGSTGQDPLPVGNPRSHLSEAPAPCRLALVAQTTFASAPRMVYDGTTTAMRGKVLERCADSWPSAVLHAVPWRQAHRVGRDTSSAAGGYLRRLWPKSPDLPNHAYAIRNRNPRHPRLPGHSAVPWGTPMPAWPGKSAGSRRCSSHMFSEGHDDRRDGDRIRAGRS